MEVSTKEFPAQECHNQVVFKVALVTFGGWIEKGWDWRQEAQIRGDCNNSEKELSRAFNQSLELKKGCGYAPKAVVLLYL